MEQMFMTKNANPFYHTTDFMEKNPSREANIRSGTEEILCLLWNCKLSFPFSQIPPQY
jgi:hypothetical protein